MDSADRLSKILSSCNLTLNSVSRRSLELYGRSSKFFVPHNLYYEVGLRGKTPTIQQLIALSSITNYSLSGWLAAFGFDLEVLWRLPFLFRRSTTALLNSEIFEPFAKIPWFTDRFPSLQPPAIAPLVKLLARAASVPAAELSRAKEGFVYARVGEGDPYAVPYFTPDSIVRANAKHPKLAGIKAGSVREAADFFLVEYEKGWTCSRLAPLGSGRVALHCPFEGFPERELRVGSNAKILGLIDAEIRPVGSAGLAPSSRITSPIPMESRQRSNPRSRHIGGLLRNLRIKLGLSLREASSMSRRIADHLGNDRYFAAAGTLSDFETLTSAPCHVEKIFTLCVLYCLGFEEFLRACNLPVDRTGGESIPDELLAGERTQERRSLKRLPLPWSNSANGFVQQLHERWKEIPFFLKDSLDSVTGIRNFSYADVFWVGSDPRPRHPLFSNAEFVAVNRRAKKPPQSNKAGRQLPLFVIMTRDGNYLCGPCTLDDRYLFLSGSSKNGIAAERFRNEAEAEVIGQITAILRRIA
jgi:hypothetical protein